MKYVPSDDAKPDDGSLGRFAAEEVARLTARHTPGPWELIPDPNGWTLTNNGQDVTSEAFDCSEADARLIAAAPDLLREAGLALGYLKENILPDGALWQLLVEPLEAAIDKATGVGVEA